MINWMHQWRVALYKLNGMPLFNERKKRPKNIGIVQVDEVSED